MKSVGEIDRRKYLGGSDIAGILGISPWKTPLDVFLDKMEPPKPVDPAKAKIFRRGHRMEPYVIDLLAEESGLVITSRGQRYKDKEHDFLAAEIDFEYHDPETGKVENGEIKTVSPFKAADWGEEQTDAIPIYYNAQSMHGLMVTGRDRCTYGTLIGGDDFRMYQVDRDEEIIVGIRQAEVEFWDRIQRNDPPPATKVSDVLRLFPKDDGTVVQATDRILQAFNDLRAKKKELAFLESECDDLADEIRLFMQGATTLSFGSRQLLTWKAQSSNRFDIDHFRTAHPSIAAKFNKTTNSRVLRLSKK